MRDDCIPSGKESSYVFVRGEEMRANKNAIIWTTTITVISLICCLVQYPNQNLIYDLSLACFGSALLSIVIASTAYVAERRDAMEQFADEVGKAISVISRIPIIEISDLVRGALKDDNSWLEKSTEDSNKLKEYIESRLPIDENTTSDQIDEWINKKYQSMIEEAREQLKKGAAAYIAVAEYNLSGLKSAYGRLDFLVGNNTIHKSKNRLYNTIRTAKLACLELGIALKPYLNGHGNEMVCIDKMLSLQNRFFEFRDDAYYAKLRDDLNHSLESFRSQIYNIEPNYEEPFPIYYSINFDDPRSVERYKRLEKRVNKEESRGK